MRLGDPARSPHRPAPVLEAVSREVADPFLDRGHRFVRAVQPTCRVPDRGSGVAYEVGEGGNAAFPEDVERAGCVRHVGTRRDDAGSQASGTGFIDHADASSWNQYVRFDKEEVCRGSDVLTHMLDQPVAILGAQLEQLGYVETLRTPDGTVDGRDGDEPRTAHGCLQCGGAAYLAEALDGNGASLQSAEHRLGSHGDPEPGEEGIQRDAHVLGVHQ